MVIYHLNKPGSEVDLRRDTVALFPPLALALANSFEDIEFLIYEKINLLDEDYIHSYVYSLLFTVSSSRLPILVLAWASLNLKITP